MRSILLAALTLLGAAAPAPDAARIKADVRTLSSDRFAGHGPGESGETMTVAFLEQSMRAIGLEPAGEAGGWTQAVPLIRLDRLPGAAIVIESDGRSAPLILGRDVSLGLRNAGVTSVRDSVVVFAGWGVVDAAMGWDVYAGVDMRGKVALLLANDPDFESGRDLGFGGRALSVAGRTGTKVAAAVKAGAAGVIVVHEEAALSWPFAQAASGDALPAFAYAPLQRAPLQFSAILNVDVAQRLLAAQGRTLAALKEQARDPRFRAVPLGDLRVSVSGANRAIPVTSRNVVGQITGTQPDEFVLYGAHWDANGRNGPDRTGDAIRNGAIDNAVGTAELLEVARAFKAGKQPRRTVVFAAWTAEEKGLLGSDWFAGHPTIPLARTAAVINLDPHVALPAARDFELIGPGQTDLEDDLRTVAGQAGLRVEPEPSPGAGWYFRSDHFPFAQRGVPALASRGGRDLVDGGTRRGDAIVAAYNRRCYHQPCDQFDRTWSMAGTAQEAQAEFAVGERIANSRRWPRWSVGVPYAAVRAASDAERR